jgi:hypothetical protein
MAKKPTQKQDYHSKLVSVPTVFVTDSLHFETEYLILRLTDALHLVQKREQLVQSAAKCLNSVVANDAEMGILRRECSLYQIKIDPDKVTARAELKEQQAELDEELKALKAVLSAVKKASKSPRTFTPKEYEKLAPDSIQVVLASLSGKAIRFEGVGDSRKLEPIETSDPRVVCALLRHHLGRPTIIE